MGDFWSGLGSAVSGFTNLLSGGGVIDAVGNALHLPPVLTQTLKAVGGAATGNLLLAANGVMGLTQELGKNPPATTEYCPPRDDARAGEGYARPCRPGQDSSPVGQGEGTLDPKMNDYLRSLQTLERNFQYLDATDGKMEGCLRLTDLQRISEDGRVSPELRQAARFLVDNPGYFERLDVSTTARGLQGQFVQFFSNDNTFDLNTLRGEIGKVKAELAAGRGTVPEQDSRTSPPPGESRPTGGCSPGSAASSSVKGIINDPRLGLEEKINAILMNLTQKMDDEILQTMDDLAAAQDKKAGISSEKGNEKALSDSQRDIDRLSLRLQQLVEKRKAMFEMMSTMSMKFNEMAKTALSNMRSA